MAMKSLALWDLAGSLSAYLRGIFISALHHRNRHQGTDVPWWRFLWSWHFYSLTCCVSLTRFCLTLGTSNPETFCPSLRVRLFKWWPWNWGRLYHTSSHKMWHMLRNDISFCWAESRRWTISLDRSMCTEMKQDILQILFVYSKQSRRGLRNSGIGALGRYPHHCTISPLFSLCEQT